MNERVDPVLLADGLHGAFKPGGHHVVEEAHMAPFVRFATLAASGERLMAITHSGIETSPTYVSTTETAAYLERTLEVTVTPMADEGARGMKRTSHAERGSLTVIIVVNARRGRR